MSLLREAMKAKLRERAAQASSEPNQPLSVDGFLPYVSSTPQRAWPRRSQVAVIGTAAVLLLVIATWLAWPKDSQVPSQGRPPIILPPPVTVSQKPISATSPAPSTADRLNTTPVAERTTAPASEDVRPPATAPATDPQPVSRQEVLAPTGRKEAEPAERREAPASEPTRLRAPIVDYESQATMLFNAGDLAGAKEKFELATRFAPSARVWTNFGVTLQRLGDLKGASAAYRSAIGMDGNYLEAWLYQGRVAAEQGDLTKAVPLFHRALAINPRNAEANVELARLEYESHNWTEARRFAEAALRGDATNIRAYWYLAVASDPLKDTDAAIRGYSGFLRYVGDTPDQTQFVGWARTRLAELRGKP